jgi:hypothetical protein
VWGWGYNYDGELGDGTTMLQLAPVQTVGLSGVVAISAGQYHSLALKNDGTVWAWGWNPNGAIGDGTTSSRSVPVQVTGLSDVVAIAAGGFHSLALKADGSLWSWGNNADGELGIGTTANQLTPVQVTAVSSAVAIAGGTYHSLAVRFDGTTWAWGYNGYGQLGDGTTLTRTSPVAVSGLSNATGIAGGWGHSLAVKADGTVWAWGFNAHGEIGDGTFNQRLAPVQVTNLSGVESVAAGDSVSFAIKSAGGAILSWGWGFFGQLGNGTRTDNQTTPIQVANRVDANLIAPGSFHGLELQGLLRVTVPPDTDKSPPLPNGAIRGIGVQSATGNFTMTVVDIAIAGRGPTPLLSRTYNSNDPYIGPLGPGWTHHYNIRLHLADDGSGSLILVGPQGPPRSLHSGRRRYVYAACGYRYDPHPPPGRDLRCHLQRSERLDLQRRGPARPPDGPLREPLAPDL